MKQNWIIYSGFKETFFSLFSISLCLSSLAAESNPSSTKPNILFCLADDWGWPHAGAYGDKVVKTPAFDRLAKEGVLFEHAFVSSPSCTPSRNALLTGQQFYRLGKGANLWSSLDVKHPNFMFILRNSGYEIGHWRKAWGPGTFQKEGYSKHPCGPESDFATFIKKRNTDKPFCFWFGTSDPHRGYTKGSGRKSGINIDQVHIPRFYPDTEVVRNDIADYYFEVQRWDKDVGEAIKLLEEKKLLENTIIVMTGDHGMPFPRCKANLYDWGTRVPLAIRWGAHIKSNRRLTDYVSFTDLAPTFLDAAGVDIPAQMTGKTLLPILRNERQARVDDKRDFVVLGRERHTPAQKKPSIDGYPARAIRTDDWLLILNLEEKRWPAGVPTGASNYLDYFSDCDHGPTKSVIMKMKDDPKNKVFYDLCFGKREAIELYDCNTDLYQINNLANDPNYASVIKKLRTQLVDYLKLTGDPRYTDKPVKFDIYPYR